MSELESKRKVLRVAIIGSGPAGFYTVSNFLKHPEVAVEIDMYERLPTPFGLVRAGVAPDHQKYKSVTRNYDKSAQGSSFRFFGNVEYGKHIGLTDLREHYHQIVFATGAQSDRSLGIPGEALKGSHSATDFVAWYNAHPDYTDHQFDLSGEAAAIVGLGNVAVDIARILCKSPAELRETDIADHALEALQHSRIKTVYILGRRGPAQAAFTPPEIKEMGELQQADVHVPAEEAALDALSEQALAASQDKNAAKNVEIIRKFSQWQASGREKQLIIRFLVSPLEIIGDAAGKVVAIKLCRNEVLEDDAGGIRAQATSTEEIIPVDLVFRSVGYRGVPLADIPFDEDANTFRNVDGRIVDESGQPVPGLYAVGWIKRGPTGVIGTNKTDARETVGCMVEDALHGRLLQPAKPDIQEAIALVESRQPDLVSYQDWQHIDEHELSKGSESGRPRVKFSRVSDMLDVLER